MSNQFMFIAVLGSMGLFCLIFTNTAARYLSLFVQIGERTKGNKIEPQQTWARPTFIRLMGLAQLGMALLVYFGKVST